MLVDKLKIKIQTEGINDSTIEFKMFPIENIQGLLQYLKDLESELGYTAFNVSFNVYDFEEGEE
jgi:hypothetical protein